MQTVKNLKANSVKYVNRYTHTEIRVIEERGSFTPCWVRVPISANYDDREWFIVSANASMVWAESFSHKRPLTYIDRYVDNSAVFGQVSCIPGSPLEMELYEVLENDRLPFVEGLVELSPEKKEAMILKRQKLATLKKFPRNSWDECLMCKKKQDPRELEMYSPEQIREGFYR